MRYQVSETKKEENTRSRHQLLFGKNVRKTETCGLQTLSLKGSRVIFMHGKCISTPRVRNKGRKPLMKCAIMTSKLCIFLFYLFYVIFPFICVFLCFFILCVFYVFYFFVVDKGVSLAPTYLRCDDKIRPT